MSNHTGTAFRLVEDARPPTNNPQAAAGESVLFHRERVRSTTKTRKSVETRRRIIEETSKLMMERGNTAFQMSEISRRCGVSKGALYYYFADKEDLLAAVYEGEIDRLVNMIDGTVEQADTAAQALQGICGVYATCVRTGGTLTMALVRELFLAREGSVVGRKSRPLCHIVDVVAEQLERAKDEGYVRSDVNARLTAMSVCGAYAFAAMSTQDNRSDVDETSFAEDLLDIVTRGIGA